MDFQWPELLWCLLIVPVVVLLYLYLLRRKNKLALRYANLSLVREAMVGRVGFRRHVPPLLFLAALTLMVAAAARPQAVMTLPSQRSTVILTIDVSGSMRAEDVAPNRLAAAQEAAKAFINEQPHDVRIGVVAFASTALLVQAPTFNREDVLKAVERFELQRGTAIGSGILVSLKTLFPDGNFEINRSRDRIQAYWNQLDQQEGRQGNAPLSNDPAPVPPGSNANSVIILLSDGQATTGPDPTEAARKAAERGVRVFTVGLGSRDGAVVGFGGRNMRVQLDEEGLQRIADVTRGQYFRAQSAADLKTIYKSLNTQLIMETKKTEITAFFSAAAAILALLAAGLSLLWFNRIL